MNKHLTCESDRDIGAERDTNGHRAGLGVDLLGCELVRADGAGGRGTWPDTGPSAPSPHSAPEAGSEEPLPRNTTRNPPAPSKRTAKQPAGKDEALLLPGMVTLATIGDKPIDWVHVCG